MAIPTQPSPGLRLAEDEPDPPQEPPLVTSGPIARRPLTTAKLSDEQFDQVDWKAMRDKFIPRMNERIQAEKDRARGLARNDFINYDVKMNDHFPPAPSTSHEPSAEKAQKDAMTGLFGRNRKPSKMKPADDFENAEVIDEETLRKNMEERPRVDLVFQEPVARGVRELPNPAGQDRVDYYLAQIACNDLVNATLDPDILGKPIPKFCETYHQKKKEYERCRELAWDEEDRKRLKHPRRHTTQCERPSFADVVYMVAQKQGLAWEREIRVANRPRRTSVSMVQSWHKSISNFSPAVEAVPEHQTRKDSLSKLSAMNNSTTNLGDISSGGAGSSLRNDDARRPSYASAGSHTGRERSSGATKTPPGSSRHTAVLTADYTRRVRGRLSGGSQGWDDPEPPDPLDWNRAFGGPSKRSSRESTKRGSEESGKRSSTRSNTLSKIIPVLDKVLGDSTQRKESISSSTSSGKTPTKNKFFRELEDGAEDDFLKVFGFGVELKQEPLPCLQDAELFSLAEALRAENVPLPVEPHDPENGNIAISKPLDGSLHKGTFAREVHQNLNPSAIKDENCGYRLLDHFQPHDHRIHVPEFLKTDLAHLAKKKLYRGAVDINHWEQQNITSEDANPRSMDRNGSAHATLEIPGAPIPKEDLGPAQTTSVQRDQDGVSVDHGQHPCFRKDTETGDPDPHTAAQFPEDSGSGSSSSSAGSTCTVKGKGKAPMRVGYADSFDGVINLGDGTHRPRHARSDTATIQSLMTTRSNITLRIKHILGFHGDDSSGDDGSDTGTIRLPMTDLDESDIHPLLRKTQKPVDVTPDIMQAGYLLLVREYEQKKTRLNPNFKLNSGVDGDFWDQYLPLPKEDAYTQCPDDSVVSRPPDHARRARSRTLNHTTEPMSETASTGPQVSPLAHGVNDLCLFEQSEILAATPELSADGGITIAIPHSLSHGIDHCHGWNPPRWFPRDPSIELDLQHSEVSEALPSASAQEAGPVHELYSTDHNIGVDPGITLNDQNAVEHSVDQSPDESSVDTCISTTESGAWTEHHERTITARRGSPEDNMHSSPIQSDCPSPSDIAQLGNLSESPDTPAHGASHVAPPTPTLHIISATPRNTVKGKGDRSKVAGSTPLATVTTDDIAVRAAEDSEPTVYKCKDVDPSDQVRDGCAQDLASQSRDVGDRADPPAMHLLELLNVLNPAVVEESGISLEVPVQLHETAIAVQGPARANGAVDAGVSSSSNVDGTPPSDVLEHKPKMYLSAGTCRVTPHSSESHPRRLRTPSSLPFTTRDLVPLTSTSGSSSTSNLPSPGPLRGFKRATSPATASAGGSRPPISSSVQQVQVVSPPASETQGLFLPDIVMSPTEERFMNFPHAGTDQCGQQDPGRIMARGATPRPARGRSASATVPQSSSVRSRIPIARDLRPMRGSHRPPTPVLESGYTGTCSKNIGSGLVGAPFITTTDGCSHQPTPTRDCDIAPAGVAAAGVPSAGLAHDRPQMPGHRRPPGPPNHPGQYADTVDAAYKARNERVAAQRAAILGSGVRAQMSHGSLVASGESDRTRPAVLSRTKITPHLGRCLSSQSLGIIPTDASMAQVQLSSGNNGPSFRSMRSPTNDDVLRSAYGDEGMTRCDLTSSVSSGQRLRSATSDSSMHMYEGGDPVTTSPSDLTPGSLNIPFTMAGEARYGTYGEHLLQYRGGFLTGSYPTPRSFSSDTPFRSWHGINDVPPELLPSSPPLRHADDRRPLEVVTAPVPGRTLRSYASTPALRPDSPSVELETHGITSTVRRYFPSQPLPLEALEHIDRRRRAIRHPITRTAEGYREAPAHRRPIVPTHEALQLVRNLSHRPSDTAGDATSQQVFAGTRAVDQGRNDAGAEPSLAPTLADSIRGPYDGSRPHILSSTVTGPTSLQRSDASARQTRRLGSHAQHSPPEGEKE